MEPIHFGLAVLWTCVTLVALRNAKRRVAGYWNSCAGLAASLASIAMFRWNVQLWRAAQTQLRDWDLYQDRAYIKVAIAAVLLLVALTLLRRYGRRFWKGLCGGHLAFFATLGAVVYVILLTLSLDNYMPRFFAGGNGRYITEYSLGALALMGTLYSVRSVRL